MSEESGVTGGRHIELLMDVNYVLFVMMVFMSLDVYFAFVFSEPLCKTNLKEATETISVGHLAVFVCFFSCFYTISFKARKVLFRMTNQLVSPIMRALLSDRGKNEEILHDYFVEDEELLEYALQKNSSNLYAEVKEHEVMHFRFIRVCELTFSIGVLLLVSIFSADSTLSMLSSFLGAFRWLLIVPILLMLLWAAHAPLYNEKKIYVGKKLAETIHKTVEE